MKRFCTVVVVLLMMDTCIAGNERAFRRVWFCRHVPAALEEGEASIRRTPEGWLVDFGDSTTSAKLNVPHSSWLSANPDAIVLTLEIQSGSATVIPNLVHTPGWWFSAPGQEATSKSGRLVFDIKSQKDAKGRTRLMNLELKPSTPNTRILLKSADYFHENYPGASELELSVNFRGKLLALFTGTEGDGVSFILRNRSSERIRRPASFNFTNLYGDVYVVRCQVDLEACGESVVVPETQPPTLGAWYGEPDQDGYRAKFAIVPYNGLERPENPEFGFAIDNHWINPNVVEALKHAGIRAIRSIVGWERIHPKGADDWNLDAMDSRLKMLEAAGIRMRETLVFTPK